MASGSHGEIVAQSDANTKSVEALFAAAETRPDKAATAEELALIAMLNGDDFTGRNTRLQENIANVTSKVIRHLLGFYQRPVET